MHWEWPSTKHQDLRDPKAPRGYGALPVLRVRSADRAPREQTGVSITAY